MLPPDPMVERATLTGLTSVVALVLATGSAEAQCDSRLRQLSSDPFTNSTSQHRTEVEPDTFVFGSTIVTTFQVGRFFDGGASDIGWATSTDGALTWTQASVPTTSVIGGQPVVQPNGTVIVPLNNGSQSRVQAVTSTDGGASYAGPVTIAIIAAHPVSGNLRTSPLPSAEIDGAGRVYVAWQDCRFRSGCASNDIVFSTSSDGTTWFAPSRVPIDPTTSTVDHFIPGLAVDRTTAGASAHLGLTYYYYPNAACSAASCQLSVGFISSTNGGA